MYRGWLNDVNIGMRRRGHHATALGFRRVTMGTGSFCFFGGAERREELIRGSLFFLVS